MEKKMRGLRFKVGLEFNQRFDHDNIINNKI